MAAALTSLAPPAWGLLACLARLARRAIWLTPLLAGAPASAQLTDPTRPPPAMTAAGQADAPLLHVTSVFLMGKRPYAIVDTLTVRVGDPLGDGKVRAITEHGVWLGTPAGKRLLPLVPDIDKRSAGKNNPLEKTR